MFILAPTETVPLSTDTDGVIRVSKTRVSIDTIVTAFKEGATAEEIAQQYSTLSLADVYSVIGYYLKHFNDIDAYLDKRKKLAKQVRKQNEARYDPNGIRERLMNRQSGE